MVWGAFICCKEEDVHQEKIELNQTGYHSKQLHDAILSETQFVGQRFLLIQDNDRKHSNKLFQRYIKSKGEEQVLQRMSWPAQSAELMWDELDRKVRAKQHTIAAHFWCRKAEQNYFQSTSSLWWKEFRESVNQW